MLTSFSSFAVDVYLSEERIDKFACVISKSIKEAYPDKSRRDLRRGIRKVLRKQIKPWVDAYPIPAGISMPRFIQILTGLPGLPMDRSEYYLQNAFILYGNPNLELQKPIDNYFASYIHLARTRHINYLNGDEPKFQLRNEEDLFQQIEEHLPKVANNAYPYLDEDGKVIQQNGKVSKEKYRFKLAIGKPKHKQYDKFVLESQRHNHFSSPLFVWLLEQENFSVTIEKLFEKALEIYGDPIVALGVIPWIFSGDALTVNRGNSSVVSYKIERLVKGNDVAGLQYHFWGYLTQGIVGSANRVGLLAYLYEKVYQKDIPDWKVDVLSLKLGRRVRKNLKKRSKNCL